MDGKNRRKKLKENKNRFKLNKVIIYVYSNSSYLFSLYYIRTKKFKNK